MYKYPIIKFSCTARCNNKQLLDSDRPTGDCSQIRKATSERVGWQISWRPELHGLAASLLAYIPNLLTHFFTHSAFLNEKSRNIWLAALSFNIIPTAAAA